MSPIMWLFTALWASAFIGFGIICLLEIICWIVATVRDWFR